MIANKINNENEKFIDDIFVEHGNEKINFILETRSDKHELVLEYKSINEKISELLVGNLSIFKDILTGIYESELYRVSLFNKIRNICITEDKDKTYSIQFKTKDSVLTLKIDEEGSVNIFIKDEFNKYYVKRHNMDFIIWNILHDDENYYEI